MLGPTISEGGYVCTPYLQNESFSTLKETFKKSDYVDDMYYVTATFSDDAKPYFPLYANTYLLARFRDQTKTMKEVEKYQQDAPTFIFSRHDEFFDRLNESNLNMVSIYYLEYGNSGSDITDLAIVVARRNRVRRAEMGRLELSSHRNTKFTFPYGDNLIVLDISSEKGHQSDNKYCEKTRKEVQRKGIGLINLLNLSIIERIK
jgi:hypothetical protein